MKNLRFSIFVFFVVAGMLLSATQTVKAFTQLPLIADRQSSNPQQGDVTPVITVNVTSQVNVTTAPSDSGGINTTLLIIIIVAVLVLLIGILIGTQRRTPVE